MESVAAHAKLHSGIYLGPDFPGLKPEWSFSCSEDKLRRAGNLIKKEIYKSCSCLLTFVSYIVGGESRELQLLKGMCKRNIFPQKALKLSINNKNFW